MAENEQSRPGRPEDSDAAETDEVYGLVGDDEPDEEPEEESVGGPASVDFLTEDAEGRRTPRSKTPKAPPPSAEPLPRIWKLPPNPREERAKRRQAAKEEAPHKEKEPSRGLRESSAPRDRARAEPIERVGQVRSSSKSRSSDAPAKKKPVTDANQGQGGTNQGKGGLEETPTYDTFEARQRVRTLLGAALFVFVVFGGIYLVRSILPSVPSFDDGEDEMPVASETNTPAARSHEVLEQEASTLLERARETAKKGDAKLAITLLERLIASYPNTAASREAKDALARPARNLPLFVDRPAVVANPVAPKATPALSGSEVAALNAAAPTPAPAGSAEVGLVVPANPAEGASKADSTTNKKEPEPHVGKPLPKGFRSRPGTVAHSSGWATEIVGDRDGAIMVLVPGGNFMMGDDKGNVTERPAHRVYLSTYYIDQHEVTVRQFNLFEKEIGRRTERVRALARDPKFVQGSEDTPVVMVSAKEAKDYATWAGKYLPTEAQWEMAARGPDSQLYSWGNLPAIGVGPRDHRKVGPIMAIPQDVSPFGAYDMGGNAWEWTKDWYDSRYFALFKNQVRNDPTGPTNVPRTLQLSVKGGSKTWAVTHREGLKFENRMPFLGFRCVLQVEGPGNAFEPPPKPSTRGNSTATGGSSSGGDVPPPF